MSWNSLRTLCALAILGVVNPAILSAQETRSQSASQAGSARYDGAHPAVARIIAPGRGSISYGSGILVAASDQHAVVLTNWHVIEDATETIVVVFPDGFRSAAKVLRADRLWDLAALAIWRPPAAPVPIAADAPRPGEPLAIAGYGPGWYRAAWGRCLNYVAPAQGQPAEMVELGTSARQGDSGGPIFNARGEVAGVLFGTGGGQTIGSYGGRVRRFLDPVWADFQRLAPATVAQQNPAASPASPANVARPATPESGVAAKLTPAPLAVASPGAASVAAPAAPAGGAGATTTAGKPAASPSVAVAHPRPVPQQIARGPDKKASAKPTIPPPAPVASIAGPKPVAPADSGRPPTASIGSVARAAPPPRESTRAVPIPAPPRSASSLAAPPAAIVASPAPAVAAPGSASPGYQCDGNRCVLLPHQKSPCAAEVHEPLTWSEVFGSSPREKLKSTLAAFGLVAMLFQGLRLLVALETPAGRDSESRRRKAART